MRTAAPWSERVLSLPRLGVGISAEFGIRPSLDPLDFQTTHPDLIHFVEFGTDVDRGLIPAILSWVESGRPATYHFLDVNFEEPEDLDASWLSATQANANTLHSPWLCGDAGLWHFGPRDRGHGLLLPPILNLESARTTALSIRRLASMSELPVIPENPPSTYYVGDLHLLEYFAHVVTEADTGFLLDVAHLAIFQRVKGLSPRDGLLDFPLERVVEVHVAGGGEIVSEEGFHYIEDDHRAEISDDVWALLKTVIDRAKNLRAVVYECEHNRAEDTIANFQRLNEFFPRHG